jgi:hypothetical protein
LEAMAVRPCRADFKCSLSREPILTRDGSWQKVSTKKGNSTMRLLSLMKKQIMCLLLPRLRWPRAYETVVEHLLLGSQVRVLSAAHNLRSGRGSGS